MLEVAGSSPVAPVALVASLTERGQTRLNAVRFGARADRGGSAWDLKGMQL